MGARSIDQGADHRSLVIQGMIRIPVQILVSVGWFSKNCSFEGTVLEEVDTRVQECNFPVFFHFLGELDVGVATIQVVLELVNEIFMEDTERVVHVSEPNIRSQV